VPGQDSYSTYNVVAYVILFAMIATRLKTRPQVWRLLGAVVAMGVLVSGYAVLQHYGQDFLHLSESTGGHVTSFMGNRIFAAAVMMMTIPVTAGAAATSLFRLSQPSDPTRSKGKQWAIGLAMLGIWVAALTIQLLGLLFTLSRGPWIGSLFALLLMTVLVAVFVGGRGLSRLALVLGLASVVTVMVFFYPGAASTAFDERTNAIPVAIDPTAADVVDRFSTISGDVLGGFSGGRLTHWKVSWGLIVDRPWFAFDSLSLRWLRPLVGYGPDMFRFTYLLYSTAEGPDRFLLAPDHAHNYFIHQTVEQGFLGTISSLGIFAAVFLAGGHQLLRTRNQMTPAHRLILIALLSVLAGRSLEMMVGVAKISDLTVLWVLLGLFAALPTAMRTPEPRRQDESPGHPPSRPAFFPVPRVKRSLWIWKLVVVILVIGTIANLTWTKGISYPLAAVQAGRALEHFNQGDLSSTLTAIDNAIESAPDVPVYYNWRALVFSAYRRDRAGLREPHCDTQIDLPYRLCLATLAHQSNLNGSSQRPFEFRARIALANSAANLDQDAESIRYYQDSLDMVPGSWGLRNNMA
jgi:O-antigen ligase